MTIPLRFDPPIDGGVVVGYDGSGPGLAALRWAALEATAHRLPLHVVRAWTLSTAARDAGAGPGFVPSLDECADAVRSRTRHTLDEIGGTAADGGPAPAVHLHVVHGRPGDVLVAAAEHADLMVVGHRGHNVFPLSLGSVAEHVLDHAGCPVVVLPGRRPGDRPAAP